ncbi:MAG TPA: DUF3618 domain-containing protein [Kofleriaceae bacterium]|nr:DUF3618 domain-containing protein [Kofleriaceae bacterium]
MRNREVIEREMYRAREDLEANLSELKHVVQEKVDVKARARVAVEKGKLMAADAFDRSKQTAREYALRGKDGAVRLAKAGNDKVYFTYLRAKDRPVLTSSIIVGVVATGVLTYYVGRRRCWW